MFFENVLFSKINSAFMRKIPPNCEGTNVLIGSVDFLDAPVYAFVRLVKGMSLPDIIEVAIPTRFFFILLGPCHEHPRYHEIGRSIGTLMSDEVNSIGSSFCLNFIFDFPDLS